MELARTTAALRSAFRIAHLGGLEVDFAKGLTAFSAELCELLGSPPLPPMPTADAEAFWCEEDRPRFHEALARVERRGERMFFEGRAPAADGTIGWWRVFGEPVFEGGRCVALRGAGQDITDWRETVERERAAVRAAEAMSGFLATMSHEIRTPLNGVLGMAQAMGRGELAAEQRERLEVIQTSGAALLSLLDDLLDLSKAEAGRVELEMGVVDAEALAESARSIFTALAGEKGVALKVAVAAEARGGWIGDPRRLRQVLHNLIGNAVKFTDRGSIKVRVGTAGDRLTLTVRDTGPGIPAAMVDKVFDRFVQADASNTRRYGGSGLGLTICRDLVTLMGGEIGLKSVEGVGTAFTVSLPLARAGAAPTAEVAAQTLPPAPVYNASAGVKVLAAEDNDANRRVLRCLLGAVGIEPVMVSNGREAVAAWRSGHWDIVLMDIQMPVMDGITAARLIRETERREGLAYTPIIAVTANAMTHHEAEYRAAGIDAMVAKPINLTALIQTMGAALELEKAA